MKTRLRVLILQHPQEPDEFLGSGRLTELSLEKATLKIGLSWPNLTKALGQEAQPSKWVVLYLGSGIKGEGAPRPGLHLVDKKGIALPPDKVSFKELEGLVVIDGTWTQAKALWWRNAWLLKARRAILVPSRPSLYGELRREPRRECVSTIESVAEALVAMGEPAGVGDQLRTVFAGLLKRKRESMKAARDARLNPRQEPPPA